MNDKTNLAAYLLGLDLETVWMHFYAGGCEVCPRCGDVILHPDEMAEDVPL